MLTGTLRLGVITGATPGIWISRWRERYPAAHLEFVPLEVATQSAALTDDVDAALVRLPIDARAGSGGIHTIALYDDVAVAVCAADSHLTAATTLNLADLAGEVLIVASDDALRLAPDFGAAEGLIAAAFAAPATTEDAIELAAAGTGIVITPMSLARLHHRKDVEYRPVTDAPPSRVAFTWPVEPRDPAVSPLVEAFMGIVRGRTAQSSRG